MINKELFIEALSTLFFSWSSDAPAEATWAGNNLLEWYEKEYNVSLGVRFSECYDEDKPNCNYDQVIEAIMNN